MGVFGAAHWLILIIVAAFFCVPVGRVLSRVGMNPWLSLLAMVPLVNVICLWVFAFVAWPRDSAQPTA
jgi:hypothetical protein